MIAVDVTIDSKKAGKDLAHRSLEITGELGVLWRRRRRRRTRKEV